jgi:uncharacterized protein YjbI with pentapeptide repeats
MSARARILIAAAAIAMLALPSVALGDTTPPTTQKVDQLFVQSAHHGTLTPTKKAGSFHLALHRTARQTHSIYCCIATSDHRTVTQERQIPTRGFMNAWTSFGFKADPPGAVLNLLHAAPEADTVALRLTHPKTRNRGRRISYHARLLDTVGSNLQGYASQLDRHLPHSFNSASLYIDQETAPVAGGCTGGSCGTVNGCVIQPYSRCAGFDLSHSDLRNSNLSHADVSYANLSYADLTNANLYYAELENADLSNATMEYVHLTNTILEFADLSNADLSHGFLHADFFSADLSYADVTNADLTDSLFSHANLTGANFRGAFNRSVNDPFYGAILCQTTMPNGTVNNDGC